MVQDFNFQPVNDRIPPQNLDAEEAILGGILLDPEAITRILDILRSEAFYSSAHQEIYKACVALHQQGSPTDLMSVSTWLNDRGLLDKLGGQSKLVQLVDRTVSAVNIDQYATLVVDKYLRRKLISTGHQISQLGHETAKDLEKVLDEAEQKVFSITQVRPNQGLIATSDILTKTFAEIEERSAGMALPGLASGFYDLDGKTQGFQRSDLIIVAGRPSMGKCLAHDAELVLADGSIATIEEIYQRRQAELLTLNDNWKFSVTEPSAFIDDGIKPVFRVTTRLGRTVETTLTHPYLTLDGWLPLSSLRVGDRIAVPRIIDVFGKVSVAPSEIDRLVELSMKEIPSFVFQLVRDQLATFLNRLLANGYVLHHEKLARQVQHLLLRFGVVSQLQFDSAAQPVWKLDLIDATSIEVFDSATYEAQAGSVLCVQRSNVLQELANSDVYWDEITAIEFVGEKQVYDLTIPKTHNFVANDICVHNTAFCLGLGRNIAAQYKLPVAVFSLEMSKEQIVQRLLASEARIESGRLRSGRIASQDWEPLSNAIGRLSELRIFIDDTPNISVVEMRSRARKLQAEQGGALGMILIDYLQLMEGSGSENRVQELARITRALKGLARELNVPVIALSQLSRSVESRADKRPMMSDLRESGSIEQDADLVMMLYRDEYYNEDTPDRGIAEVLITKHRNGPTGTIKLLFEPQFTRFLNLASPNRFDS
ncbi:replicative DNA helicase [Leptolyngbya sp. AN03gr2]|uniref:replicative DNA helicase n=1 Tax=unclassified Leptolyngbya TaxID=2650499 RepID=UPI003D311F58